VADYRWRRPSRRAWRQRNARHYNARRSRPRLESERAFALLAMRPPNDLEGAASRTEALGIVSHAGWILVWEASWQRVRSPRRRVSLDLSIFLDKGHGDKPPKSDACLSRQEHQLRAQLRRPVHTPSCARRRTCAVSLRRRPTGSCTSSSITTDDSLSTSPSRSLSTRRGALADCAFSDDGTLLAASFCSTLRTCNRVRRLAGSKDGKVGLIAPLASGSPRSWRRRAISLPYVGLRVVSPMPE